MARIPARLRRLLSVVLLMNVSVGMAFSVILLHHQVDNQHRAQVDVIELDRLVTAHALALVSSESTGPSASTSPVDELTASLRAASVRLTSETSSIPEARDLAGSVESYLHRAPTESPPVLESDASALHSRAATISARQEAANRRAGHLADGETLFIMIFAAGMAGLLVRRLLTARQAELLAARQRARAEARFRSLIHHSSDVISVLDADTTIRFQTPSLKALLGWDIDELRATPLTDLVHPEDRVSFLTAHRQVLDGVHEASGSNSSTGPAREVVSQIRLRHRDGTYRHLESVHTNLLGDGDVHGVVVNSRDVTERVSLQDRLEHSALHDPLTGLANRVLFADRVSQALNRGDRQAVAVVYLDLDDFKSVNDSVGATAGDALLIEVADRLRGAVRNQDTVARLGGDEFALLLEDVEGVDDVAVTAERLRQLVPGAIEIGALPPRAVSLSASLGVALAEKEDGSRPDAPPDGVEAMLRNADTALYAAKGSGKNRVVVHEPGMSDTLLERLQLRAELGAALDRGEFAVHYQPTIDLRSGAVQGVEALVRWHHPTRGVVPPVEFIPLAEESGAIVALGRWVLAEACNTVVGWHARHPDLSRLSVAVNLSARELVEPDLLGTIRTALASSGLAPALLTLEVTESMLLADFGAAADTLRELRTWGVKIAIDDFGTGYSSLSYLEHLSVDILKIDKSFVDRLAPGRGDTLMIETITNLGHALGLEVVAEGVEDADQAGELQVLECDFGQGYHFARPLPAVDIETLLTRGEPLTPLSATSIGSPRNPCQSELS
ncbi:MAG TPA: EAL domain-containing protein [Frankiaceae bacterium]|nr:EAL domain-containing protein [Frankiaceae bacterium]